MIRVVFGALAASVILAASAAQAHIPAECAVRSQELGWALETHSEVEDAASFSHELNDAQIEVHGDINLDRAKRHIRQLDVVINVLENVRHKALLLFNCIHEPPSVSQLPDVPEVIEHGPSAEHRPPFDPDAYCLPEDLTCREPWTELTPPDPLQPSCVSKDANGDCALAYTPQRAWICYDHDYERDRYGPDGVVAMIERVHPGGEDDLCGFAGLGEGHSPFGETLPGWTDPRG